MTSSASRLASRAAGFAAFVALAAAAFMVAPATPAETVAASAPAPAAAWTARVATEIAARWNVPVPALRLAWGRLPAGGLPAEVARFRLLGGVDGWFVLSAEAGAGELAVTRVRAGIDDTVCVAMRELARGQRLTAEDLRLEPRVRWGAPRANTTAARPAAGWELRRAVAAGTVIEAPTALPPAMVNAGDRIELGWTRGDVVLRLSGVALHGARMGEPVRVKVDGRPRPLTAIVDAPGHARLGAREAS